MPDYLAAPEGPGHHPGVVVLHEAYGLGDDVRAKADRFASRGYLALAPDLFDDGPRVKCIVGAFAALGSGRGRVFDEIDAARAALAGRPDCTGRVGVIGFCMGGGFALLCAPRFDFAASSVNYGILPRKLTETLAGSCPIVASYGGRDVSLRGAAGKLESALEEVGVEHDVEEYPDANRSFLNHHPSGMPGLMARVTGMRYHGPSAIDAWERIDAFFDQHVSGVPAPPAALRG